MCSHPAGSACSIPACSTPAPPGLHAVHLFKIVDFSLSWRRSRYKKYHLLAKMGPRNSREIARSADNSCWNQDGPPQECEGCEASVSLLKVKSQTFDSFHCHCHHKSQSPGRDRCQGKRPRRW